MKKQIRICLMAILLIFTGATSTFAGFKVKTKEMATISATGTNVSNVPAEHHKKFSERKLPRMFSAAKAMAFPDKGKSKSGWEGIASVVCGILGWGGLIAAIGTITLLFPIAAIVFGAIGLNKKKHINTGFALAGLILGALELLIIIILAAIIAAFLL